MTSTTPLVVLCLFDGSSNSTISKTANLFIIFPTSNCINLDFYITLLDSSYSLVLGYNWLAQHNLLIDWINRLINFCSSLQNNLAPFRVIANTLLTSLLYPDIPLQSLDSVVFIPVFKTSISPFEQSNITIISTIVFLYTSKHQGFSNFELCFYSSDI